MKEGGWKDQRVLVTGACGTVGGELVRQLLDRGVHEVAALDNNEAEVFFRSEEFLEDGRVEYFMGDVRDRDKVDRHTRGVDVVLHAAAMKHVFVCEREPVDAVQTNIMGTQNMIAACRRNDVKRFLATSTDKAVNPTNVLGASKLMGERLVAAASAHQRGDGPVFASTRFGNVLGSRGSVIPVFERQIQRGGPVTLTSTEMTRFIMTLPQAVSLVLDTMFMARGGEVFVTKMPAIRIEDLAHVMAQTIGPAYGHDPGDIEVREVGPRPGEKTHEELMNDEETRRTVELRRHFAILPAFRNLYGEVDYIYDDEVGRDVGEPFTSLNAKRMGLEELKDYLVSNGLIAQRHRTYEPQVA